MHAAIDRPLTGWGERYAKGHMQLMTKEECYQWFGAVDEFGKTLKNYAHTPVFIGAPIKKQQRLLEEFAALWNLPYGVGLLRLLHHYQHIYNTDIFVDAWKAFYYRTNGYSCVHITTPSLLQAKDVEMVLEALSIEKDKCILTQKISPKLLDGLIVECNGVRYDTSALGQIQMIKRMLRE